MPNSPYVFIKENAENNAKEDVPKRKKSLNICCDICDSNFNNSKEKGGFLFLTSMVCPNCTIRTYKAVKKNHQEEYIRAICPADMTFKDFFIEVRRRDVTAVFAKKVVDKNIEERKTKKKTNRGLI